LPAAAIVASVPPMKAPAKVMMWNFFRMPARDWYYARGFDSAFNSLAPELVKNT